MAQNFWWVFSAYSIVWLGVFLYVAKLFGRQRDLEKEVQRLKDER